MNATWFGNTPHFKISDLITEFPDSKETEKEPCYGKSV